MVKLPRTDSKMKKDLRKYHYFSSERGPKSSSYVTSQSGVAVYGVRKKTREINVIKLVQIV